MKIEVKGVFKGHVQTRFPNKKRAVGLLLHVPKVKFRDEEYIFHFDFGDWRHKIVGISPNDEIVVVGYLHRYECGPYFIRGYSIYTLDEWREEQNISIEPFLKGWATPTDNIVKDLVKKYNISLEEAFGIVNKNIDEKTHITYERATELLVQPQSRLKYLPIRNGYYLAHIINKNNKKYVTS